MVKVEIDGIVEELSEKEVLEHNMEITNEIIGEWLMNGRSDEEIDDFEQMSVLGIMSLKKVMKKPETVLYIDEKTNKYIVKN